MVPRGLNRKWMFITSAIVMTYSMPESY